MSLNDYIAGAVGGCAGLAVGHPFDTTKVQLQTQQGKSAYAGTWDAIKSIHQHGWARGFFRGLAFPLASYGVVNSVFFGVYGNTLRWLNRSEDDPYRQPTYRDVFIAGCVGGAMQIIPACPIDVIKVVLQSQITHSTGTTIGATGTVTAQYYKGPLSCMCAIYKAHGIRGLYTGVQIQAIRDIPASATYWVTYAFLYKHIHQLPHVDQHGLVASFIGGGIAGMISWAIIMPFDIIKSRIQADFDKKLYKGISDCVRITYAEGGWRIFFRGIGVTCLRAFPANAVILVVYEQSLKVLTKMKKDRG
ncbi:unnamed protein product [Owenia fusiformis]|uniref:Uncharacterized protein n=1 Tax=Owenia fusiformis TaxID=6347 RepID=A0A8J1ULJ0_OWEFU|nr:unnamed protein product [Owenia fusiformis]